MCFCQITSDHWLVDAVVLKPLDISSLRTKVDECPFPVLALDYGATPEVPQHPRLLPIPWWDGHGCVAGCRPFPPQTQTPFPCF